MVWTNDRESLAGIDVAICKHGKRYDFKTGDQIDNCPECEKENG